MNRRERRMTGIVLGWGVLVYTCFLTGCVEAVPQDVVEAVESIDRDLMQLRAAEVSPDDYARFIHQWVTLKARVEAEDDSIRWPWEPNDLEAALRRLQVEGSQTVTRLTEQRESRRQAAEQRLLQVEDRSRMLAAQITTIDGKMVLGQEPVEADLLMKQAKAFYEQGQYGQSLEASQRAAHNLTAQTAALTRELGRYADPARIAYWQKITKETIDWSRKHQTSAIIVSKADRTLTLYRNGRKMLSYPVRLGFNGIREKRYQGDGATPEGRYRVTSKRGQGQTQFYRALVLDYPNPEDRKRFQLERKMGHIPASRTIGGQIEIHGIENELMAQTLGCVMLDNQQMAALFGRVENGTPVTIVGALHEQNAVALTLTHLGARREET